MVSFTTAVCNCRNHGRIAGTKIDARQHVVAVVHLPVEISGAADDLAGREIDEQNGDGRCADVDGHAETFAYQRRVCLRHVDAEIADRLRPMRHQRALRYADAQILTLGNRCFAAAHLPRLAGWHRRVRRGSRCTVRVQRNGCSAADAGDATIP